MAKYLTVLISVTLFCATVLLPNEVSAIRCYQCKSLTDPNCGKEMIDSSDRIREVDCDHQPKPNRMEDFMPVTKCNVVVTKDKAGTIVSRDCHFQIVGKNDNECMVSHSENIVSCHTCKGDLCNTSMDGSNGAKSKHILSISSLLFIGIALGLLQKF